MPPCSLSATPAPTPWPRATSPTLGLGLGLGDSLAPVHLCHPPKVCPDCQLHTALPQGTGGIAICSRLCPYELITCSPPPAWGFRTSCQVDRRKETPDWLVEEGVGLKPQPGPMGLTEVSFWGQRGTQAGFQDKHLANSALEIIETLQPLASLPGPLPAWVRQYPSPPTCIVLASLGLWGRFPSPLPVAHAPTGFTSFPVCP